MRTALKVIEIEEETIEKLFRLMFQFTCLVIYEQDNGNSLSCIMDGRNLSFISHQINRVGCVMGVINTDDTSSSAAKINASWHINQTTFKGCQKKTLLNEVYVWS